MKDQFVIACVEDAASAATVLPWARHFAERLRHKGLMALHVSREKGDDSWLRDLGVPYVSMQGEWATAIEGLPTAFNGILAVAAVNPAAPRSSLTHPKTLLREFASCKIAYLCVSDRSGTGGDGRDGHIPPISIQHSALTMTHRREGKEKLVWASYVARFLGSRITIAHPGYKDQDLRMRWRNNMRYADKIFTPMELTYGTAIVTSSTQPDLAALDELRPDLLIARTTDTRDRDLVDWFLPRPEQRLLTHRSATPLLFLNPRDDLYILCD